MKHNSISALTLGFPLTPIHISKITRFFDVPLEIIEPYVSKNPDQGKKLISLGFSRDNLIKNSPLKQNDVILSVNGEAVGMDLLRLTSILWENDIVTLKVLREQEIIDNIKIYPHRTVSSFMKSIKLSEKITVYSSNSHHSHANSLPENIPFTFAIKGHIAPICKIAITPVHSFGEFIQEFYKKIIEEKKRHITYTMNLTKETKSVFAFVIPILMTEPYINRFNTKLHKWENISLTNYITEINGGK